MVRKTGLTLLLLCVVGFVSIAQVAPLGKDIIKDFSVKLQSYSSIKATFTFTLENLQEGLTDTHDGSIALKGKNYLLDLMGMQVYFNGETKWQFIPEANEVTISKPTSVDGGFFDDPTQIFQDYEKDFKSKFIGEKVEADQSIYEVDLYPVDLSVSYSIIKLQFNKRTLVPISIKYQGKDGNNYIIDIKKFEPDVAIEATEFVFDTTKHTGIEIVDMR
ncbi:MAG TPA: outer membrane lipoprotein carrier protein LolA [Tenuifilaceae bacterium]|nr:outer membrane lipoprotein carrier protein LolA [Tenuifilaceae bacterium]HPG34303.1 outer membrane lipoprotein carrier protein LolA [Lentimicrobium sp.]HPJ44456.1 outer membrane lipoprotein carrier protein LolA [Tenuifilaceae bacterium]